MATKKKVTHNEIYQAIRKEIDAVWTAALNAIMDGTHLFGQYFVTVAVDEGGKLKASWGCCESPRGPSEPPCGKGYGSESIPYRVKGQDFYGCELSEYFFDDTGEPYKDTGDTDTKEWELYLDEGIIDSETNVATCEVCNEWGIK